MFFESLRYFGVCINLYYQENDQVKNKYTFLQLYEQFQKI